MINTKQKIIWKILRPLVIVFLYFKFGYTFKVAKNLPENYIILSNHNTDFDPLFVGASFKNSIGFVASEHISRWKHAFKFLNFIFLVITRSKGTNAASTVKEMLRALRGGDSICMFAEGARSPNGITMPILPSTGKVVKSARCALVTYKITGGYFASPMWSEGGTRRGRVHGEVVNIYSADDIAKMSTKEINDIINADLREDAYETQHKSPSKYTGKQLAVKMESVLFYCPHCESIDTLTSHKDKVTCSKCGCSFKYTKYGMIEGLEQRTFKQLFFWLKDKVESDAKNNASYRTNNADIQTVRNHKETLLSTGELYLDREVLRCGDVTISIDDIDDFAMHGKYAIVLSTRENYYEILLKDGVSGFKFFMLFQAYKYDCINKFNF